MDDRVKQKQINDLNNIYQIGYEDRQNGICRDVSMLRTPNLKQYSEGWLQAWKDEGYVKTHKGQIPRKQVTYG